jgi:hypothetical protein
MFFFIFFRKFVLKNISKFYFQHLKIFDSTFNISTNIQHFHHQLQHLSKHRIQHFLIIARCNPQSSRRPADLTCGTTELARLSEHAELAWRRDRRR